ncbi:MAG TPA: 2-oxo acid dehydrogenase subunit E2, partial [Chitinophagales bacterium]|nr:2-oxo acid dehydrogenase subunit E2 [Chitinophagales bacterium]
MSQSELIMPKMGESIMEATILKWLKKEGDAVALDEAVLEIATDKVDSEVPSPFEGVISKILYQEGDVVEVGKPIAIISGEGGETVIEAQPIEKPVQQEAPVVQETVVR